MLHSADINHKSRTGNGDPIASDPERTRGPEEDGIVIRACSSHADWHNCVALQRAIWGYEDLDIVPTTVLVACMNAGGQILGAFHGTQQVGFALAFAARRGVRAYLHSHMVAVLPAYQNRGVGRRLKLRQREEALQSGLGLIEWTFDPLEVKNAYFNIVRLGAIVRTFVPDAYGRSSSPLHGALPTDRLVAEWHLRSARVLNALMGGIHNPAVECVRLRVPSNIGKLRHESPHEAEEIQSKLRAQFDHWFPRGFAVTAFERTEDASVYVLEAHANRGSDSP
jgi:predicted GNAT superfamily acetyltransferase